MKEQQLNCENARLISCHEIMNSLGYTPTKLTAKEAWFLSPFRLEKVASFKISFGLNRWYDHGEGFGGNSLDLIIRIKQFTVSEALKFLTYHFSTIQKHQIPNKVKCNQQQPSYRIIKEVPLEHIALLNYLKSRGITKEIARIYCTELHYEIGNKMYFGIGFKNDNGGFEVRNPYYKGCFGCKAITSMVSGSSSVVIFEGFIDFLSYVALFVKDSYKEDYIILNSVALVKTLPDRLVHYTNVNLCLDNDGAGRKTVDYLKEHVATVFDCSLLYQNHKDLNEYLIQKSLCQNEREQ